MGMGQVTLGFRSLAVKLAVFFVLAMLLAWALGGTLWPRPHVAALTDAAVQVGEARYFWQASLDERQPHADRLRWTMMVRRADEKDQALESRVWKATAGPLIIGDELHFGGRDEQDQWRLVRLNRHAQIVDAAMPDQLAVEQQLARLLAGLPLQTVDEILAQRASVLDPAATQGN
jgi:hypothetical protein